MNLQSKLHGVLMFLIATLGGYAQFHPEMASLVDEHRNIKVAFYVSLSMYAVGLMALYKLQTRNYVRLIRIMKRFTPLVGILVAVLLLILLFPLLGMVAFIIWGLFMVKALIRSVQETLQWLHHVILQARQIVTTYFRPSGESDAVDDENGSNIEECKDSSLV